MMHRVEGQWPALVFVILIAAILIAVSLLPWKRWSEQILDEWAAANGYRITYIEDVHFFDRLSTDSATRVVRVWMVDDQGIQRLCRAEIGPMIRGPYSLLKITWIR